MAPLPTLASAARDAAVDAIVFVVSIAVDSASPALDAKRDELSLTVSAS
jgi:hypothetical protein